MVTLAKRMEEMGMVEGERGEEAVKMDRDFLRAGSVNDGEEVGLGCDGKEGERGGS